MTVKATFSPQNQFLSPSLETLNSVSVESINFTTGTSQLQSGEKGFYLIANILDQSKAELEVNLKNLHLVSRHCVNFSQMEDLCNFPIYFDFS